MTKTNPKILFLFSDTGGGHRSPTEAIIEQIKITSPNIQTEMLDFFQYVRWPLNHDRAIYNFFTRFPGLWGWAWKRFDHNTIIDQVLWRFTRTKFKKLIQDHPADLIVSVHPFANFYVLNALGEIGTKTPFANVVTDLATMNRVWFDPRITACLVPTKIAATKAQSAGIPAGKIRQLGLPVKAAFEAKAPSGEPNDDLPTILFMAGQNLPKALAMIEALVRSRLKIKLIVVAGQNQALERKLAHIDWPFPVETYGLTTQVAKLMQQADILVSKAGSSTICEANLTGLPIVLYDHVPGQEDGNVDFVVSSGSGVLAAHPELVIKTIEDWISHPAALTQFATASHHLANPGAAHAAAKSLVELLPQN